MRTRKEIDLRLAYYRGYLEGLCHRRNIQDVLNERDKTLSIIRELEWVKDSSKEKNEKQVAEAV